MARGVPTLIKGTLIAGSAQRYQMIIKIRNACTSYLSNGEPAWEVHTVNGSASAYDIRMHSVGDRSLGSGTNKGDVDIWVRLYNGSWLTVNTYLDFCPADGSSRRATIDKSCSIDNTTDLDYWIAVNEYECVVVILQGGSWRIVHFGHAVTGVEGTKIGGKARVTTQTSGTGTVVVDLDRDISSEITVGQRVWMLNQTPDGAGTVDADKVEIVTVDAVTASTITLSGVVNDAYSVGSLIGAYLGYNYSLAFDNTWKGTYQWVAQSNATGPYNYAYLDIPAGLIESAQDPDDTGIYRMYNVVWNFGGSRGSPGRPELTLATPIGTQTGGDRMLIGGDTNNAYWVFPGLACSGLALCIGPGAYV